MGGIGSKLREARLKWQLTLREVEERSSRLAQQWDLSLIHISPPAFACPTPWICEIFCSITVEATSYILSGPYTSEVRPIIMIGESAGFTLR